MLNSSFSYSSLNPNQQKRYISREFKKRGLSLQPAALAALLNVLRREREREQGKDKNGKSSRRIKRQASSTSISSSASASSFYNQNDILQILLNEIKERMLNDRGMGNRVVYAEGASSSAIRNQSIVTQEILHTVVADLSRDGNDVLDEAVQLLDAWKMKRLDYNVMKKRWKLVDKLEEGGDDSQQGGSNDDSKKKKGRSVFGQPCDKVDMLLQRYHLIQQRIIRQDIFQNKLSISYSSSSSNNMLQNQQHKLTPIEALLGTTDSKTLLGIIIQVEQNQYYLEDPTASIPLDLSQVEFPSTDGFITEYSIVLVEGQMSEDGEMLVVHTIGHPMYESRNDAIQHIGLQNSNIFDTIPNLNELMRLQNEELEHGPSGMFVLLSDVYLDDLNVLEKLEVLFQGFEDITDGGQGNDDIIPLPVFILMGDFASTYPSFANGGGGGASGGSSGAASNSSLSYKSFIMNLFDELANVITKFPRIAQEGRFVLIPSMNDVGLGNILPRPSLPRYFLKGLQSKVKHMHLASNPCRLRYFSKEIVFSRIDVLSKLRKNCILPPRNNTMIATIDDEDDEMIEQMDKSNNDMDGLIRHSIKTVLDQGHLCPIPPQTIPIYWQYDHALRLYPSPDILVLSESSTKRYSEKYENDVEVMNPGPFHSEYKFLVIKPCDVDDDDSNKNELSVNVEFSQVP